MPYNQPLVAPSPEFVFDAPDELFSLMREIDTRERTAAITVIGGRVSPRHSTVPISDDLIEVTHSIIRPIIGFFGKDNISIHFNHGIAQPGKTSTDSADWHYDGFDSGKGIILSDVLPTEFAIGVISPEVAISANYTRGVTSKLSARCIEPAITAGHLRVEPVTARKAYGITHEHAHRGAINKTDNTIERTFVVIG